VMTPVVAVLELVTVAVIVLPVFRIGLDGRAGIALRRVARTGVRIPSAADVPAVGLVIAAGIATVITSAAIRVPFPAIVDASPLVIWVASATGAVNIGAASRHLITRAGITLPVWISLPLIEAA